MLALTSTAEPHSGQHVWSTCPRRSYPQRGQGAYLAFSPEPSLVCRSHRRACAANSKDGRLIQGEHLFLVCRPCIPCSRSAHRRQG